MKAWWGLTCAVYLACSSDAAPKAEPTIVLPSRDAGSGTEAGPQTCDLQKDPNNCGQCGNVCPSGPRGTPACVAGKCALTCQTGFGDCNGSAGDGCETDVTSTVAHCGACDRDCGKCGGTTCIASMCDPETFTTTANAATLLTVDATHVTYADTTQVSQIAIVDQTSEPIFTVSDTPAIGTNDTAVLFVEPGTEGSAGIYSVTPGFVGPQIAAYARGMDVDTFALDDTGIYYAVGTTTSGPRQLVRCKSCTVPTVLSDNENALRTDAIALDETTVFFGSGDQIKRVDKVATNVQTLTIGQTPFHLQVDADSIYWLNEESFGSTPNGEIASMPKAGGTVTKLVTGLAHPRALVVVGESLYASDQGVIFRIAKDGSARLDLAATSSASPIAVDQACVWYADDTTIKKVSR